MRIRFSRLIISALTCGALWSGCAGGGSSQANPAVAVSAVGHQATGPAPHGAVRRPASEPTCSGTGMYSFVGGGNTTVAAEYAAAVIGGYSNYVCDDYSTIAGGTDNAISSGNDSTYSAFIGAGDMNTIVGTAASYSAIVAGDGNTVTGVKYSFIGAGQGNAVTANNAFLGGGIGNTITSAAQFGVLVGGSTNSLSAEWGVLAGGLHNTVSGEGAYIAAGGYNTASGEGAVVDGGFNSTASGTFATIPGGYVNSAAGTYSFAAGARASAANEGAFVWSDGSDGDTILTSTQAYQFLARASGGFTLYTNAASTVGAQLAAGSGTWASLSDRNVKTNIAPLDDEAILGKVAALPIERWSYKSERGVRHVGPMAQDFYAAFGVGEDDKHITSIDEDGVALAAIKALHARVGALHARVGTLDAENARLRAQLASTNARLASTDARLARLTDAVAALRAR
jgi:hypothetical protein